MSTNVTGFDPLLSPSRDSQAPTTFTDHSQLMHAQQSSKRHEPHFVNNAAVQAVRPPPTALALEPSTLLNAKHGIAVNSDAATGVVTVTPQTPEDGSSGKRGILTTFPLSNEAKVYATSNARRQARQTNRK